MKALKVIIIIFIVLLAIIMIPPLFMPAELNVEQSRVMKAQPEAIWDQVNCLANWELWDIWHQDTNLVGHYEGPACGVGSKNVWNYKNMNTGGSQTIVESREYEYIKTLLDFQGMGTADAEFMMEKKEEGTLATWKFRSDAPYPIARWINALMIKPEVTKAYQQGLANLDSLTMNMQPKPKYHTGPIVVKEVIAMNALALHTVATMEQIENAMGQAFGRLMEYAGQAGVQLTGPPFAIWYQWESETFEFDNCIPVSKADKGSGEIRAIKTYAGKVVSVEHIGSYESSHYSWTTLEKYVKENNLETNGAPWESYITDPQTEPDPAKWITLLNWPVK